MVFLPNPRYANSSAVAQKVIADLKSDNWIDRGTRAILVDLNLYNPGTKLLTAARSVVYLSPFRIRKRRIFWYFSELLILFVCVSLDL